MQIANGSAISLSHHDKALFRSRWLRVPLGVKASLWASQRQSGWPATQSCILRTRLSLAWRCSSTGTIQNGQRHGHRITKFWEFLITVPVQFRWGTGAIVATDILTTSSC